jgi:hypothetical protein
MELAKSEQYKRSNANKMRKRGRSCDEKNPDT